MKFYITVILLLILSCFNTIACQSKTNTPQGNSTQTAEIVFVPEIDDVEDVVITLERTMCLGECPVYSLTIYGNGLVMYKGEKYVGVVGQKTTTLSQRQVEQLVEAFYRTNYFSLKDSYEYKEMADGVTLTVTDLPWTYTSIEVDGTYKRVENYFGGPDKLAELENLIDEVVNSQQWLEKE